MRVGVSVGAAGTEWRSADSYANSSFRRVALIDKCLGAARLHELLGQTGNQSFVYTAYRRKGEEEEGEVEE